MDPDLNKYDLNHAVTGHPLMSQAEWEGAYRLAWETYYSDEHVERVLRRAAATKTSVGKTLFVLNWFIGSIRIEKIHPLEAGFVRLKFRRDRRLGLSDRAGADVLPALHRRDDRQSRCAGPGCGAACAGSTSRSATARTATTTWTRR